MKYKDSKVGFCRVCGFRVRVWVSYRTYKSSGLGYNTLTELTEVPGVQNSKKSGQVYKRNTGTPGIVKPGVQNSQKSGYGYKTLTEFTEVPGIVARAYRTHRSSRQVKNGVPVPPVLWLGRTELTEIPGTGMKVALKFQKYRVL